MRGGLILTIAVLLPFLSTKEERERAEQKPISLSELHQRRVLGELGHPLGEVLTIEGIAISGEEERQKRLADETLLKVQSVEGKLLAEAVKLSFKPYLPSAPLGPKIGSRFKLVGYE